MKIELRVKPNSRHPKIELAGDVFVVHLKAKPKGSEANEELIKLLAEYFRIPQIKVVIKSGKRSRNKIVHILA